jgi:hypothetical protein
MHLPAHRRLPGVLRSLDSANGPCLTGWVTGPADAAAQGVAGEVAGRVDAAFVMGPERYIADRLEQYQGWYDRKAVHVKGRYMRMRSTSVVAGAIVPVLVNVDFAYVRLFATALSVLVVVLVSLESVFHFREQWKNYRSTEQFIGHERIYFSTRTGTYSGMADSEAFRLLVERVESAIAAENASTLNTMTLAGQVSGEDKSGFG